MGARSSQSRGPGLNETDGHLVEYFRQNFGTGGGGTQPAITPSYIIASGGSVTEYTESNTTYKVHTFDASGSFEVTNTGPGSSSIDYLIIAGGGGGGAWVGGGGGAGGVISSHPDYPASRRSSSIPVSPGYTSSIVIGGGGTGWHQTGETAQNISETGTPGTDTTALSLRAAGGGMGGNWAMDQRDAGGSGAGGGYPTATPGADGNQYSPNSPAFPGPAPNQGYPGGTGNTTYLSTGGGGGAGGAGVNANNQASGNGGPGVQIKITGPSTWTPSTTDPLGRTATVGAQNPGPGEYQWYAGGGGGGHHNGSPSSYGTGGVGGGGTGAQAGGAAPNAAANIGGGGGGSGGSGGNGHGGNGGSGKVIIRYISSVAVDYVDMDEFVFVAGGGAGGLDMSGGGGGGGMLLSTTTTNNFVVGDNYTLTVGAGGAQADYPGVYGSSGSDSYCSHNFGEYRAAGGGRGGGSDPTGTAKLGIAGGSGGGGAGGHEPGDPYPGGAGSTYPSLPSTPALLRGSSAPGQGNPGGDGYGAGSGAGGTYWGGGGGGAGQAGNDAPTTAAGSGGNGQALPANLGGQTLAGGGGGCGGVYSGDGQPGGTGGGGAGAFANGTPGTTNTGGGGGGNGHVGTSGDTSGAGGSGIIKMLYPNAFSIANPGGGITMSTATPGSKNLTTFTAGTGTITFSRV